jgi:hypothetical protein
MIVFVGDLEDCRAIENRFNADFSAASVLAPQFQLPAVFVFPVLVEINQKRETPDQTGRVSHVAVDVDIELSAPRNQMVPTSLQVGVGQQLPYPRDLR